MASNQVDCQMEEDNTGIEIRVIGGTKGKGLFATKDYKEGDIIFEEVPLVCCQFPWNATCGYRACDFCMRSLESTEENVRRLLKKPDIVIPHPECCITDKTKHCQCDMCGVEYCSEECRERARSQYHEILCLRSREREGNHPLEQLNEAWKQMYYPPETSSIMLFVRILALVNQAKDKGAMLHQFSQFCQHTVNEDEEIAHKLLGENFAQQLEMLREMMSHVMGSPDVQHWLTPEGFRSLIAMVGTNGQGVGSSPLAEWARRVGELEGLPESEKEELDAFVDKLYEDIEDETAGFLNSEGSALYALQSKCNHSCAPNAEICFLHANSRLSLRTARPICSGEEICISYLSPCDVERSRHSRHKQLKQNYLFVCGCLKCSAQSDEPDVTSDEEFSSECEED